jgi:hypothetical protein
MRNKIKNQRNVEILKVSRGSFTDAQLCPFRSTNAPKDQSNSPLTYINPENIKKDSDV